MQTKLKLSLRILVFPLLFIISMAVNILALVLAPAIALISIYTDVPRVFNFLLTHDNPIDGDEGHLSRWTTKDDFKTKFLRRTAWLWRNKGYSFDYYQLGCPIGNHLVTHGDPATSSEGHQGWLFQYNEYGYFEFYLVKPYSFNKNKCLRVRLGIS